MNLTEEPEVTTWPGTHYVYVGKIGPFQEAAPQAWTSLHALTAAIAEHNTITGYMSLYTVAPQTYRAGVAVSEKAKDLPEGVEYMFFEGGKYSKFVLTGPYSDLPAACGRVFEIVADNGIPVADNYFIENYVNDPRVTPEDQTITEILIPTV
jgi:effector-binding domain-containing protein